MIRFRKAVLMIHGFAGGTYDAETLAFRLELEPNLDVYTFTLPGHDKSIMVKAKREDWVRVCEEKTQQLINNGYRKIYVIGHSMGGVLACHLAVKFKEVEKIVLAAPAFEALDSENGNVHLLASLKKTPKIMKDYPTDEIVSRMLKMPTMMLEFQKLILENQQLPEQVTCPTLLIHGTLDQIVPLKSSQKIYEKLEVPYKKFIIVKDVNHHIFKSNKTDVVIEQIVTFLKKKPSKKEGTVEL